MSTKPLPPTPCKRQHCFPCSSSLSVEKSTGSSKCWSKSTTYLLTCLPCQSTGQRTQYWGETGHNAYTRGRNHWEGLLSKHKTNILHQHAVTHHGGPHHQLTPKDFTMRVERSHHSNISRQIHEGILISQQLNLRDQEQRVGLEQPRKILNSRTEFYQPGLITPRAMKILY